MEFLPGSHHGGQRPHRAGVVAGSVNRAGQAIVGEVDDRPAMHAPLRAGEFSLHHTLCLHRSQPNQSARASRRPRDQLRPDLGAASGREAQDARHARPRRRHLRPLRPRACAHRRPRLRRARRLRPFVRRLPRRLRRTGARSSAPDRLEPDVRRGSPAGPRREPPPAHDRRPDPPGAATRTRAPEEQGDRDVAECHAPPHARWRRRGDRASRRAPADRESRRRSPSVEWTARVAPRSAGLGAAGAARGQRRRVRPDQHRVQQDERRRARVRQRRAEADHGRQRGRG